MFFESILFTSKQGLVNLASDDKKQQTIRPQIEKQTSHVMLWQWSIGNICNALPCRAFFIWQ
jgi:hypothetical protein